MKNYLKTYILLRWMVAGFFGLILTFNVMVSLDFDKNKLTPSLTLTELGNQAYAQSESPDGICCEVIMFPDICKTQIYPVYREYYGVPYFCFN